MQRRPLLALVTATAAALISPLAQAQAWPTRPVRVVVPAPAGSSLDVIARLMSDKLAARWGQPVVVDNKAGAGGMLGMDAVAKAAPDGHTLGLGFNGPIAFGPFLYKKMPYDPAKDLAPVVMTTSQPNVLAVNVEKVPAKTLAEFIAWAKAQKGAVNYSSLGNGSSAHLTMAFFLSETGLTATHIPFNGSPAAALAVAQGTADATFMVAPALLPHVRNNKVRLLAVSSAQRPDSLKDLPTLAEGGVKNVEALAWNGFFATAGTPEAVLSRINADVNELLHDAAIKTALDAQGLTPVGGSVNDFRRAVEADVKRWGPIIARIGVKLD